MKNVHRNPLLALWLICLTMFLAMSWQSINSVSGGLFWLLACIVQASLFSAPAYFIGLLTRITGPDTSAMYRVLVVARNVVCVVTVILVVANYKLEAMYGFFIDTFVLNIVTTPGGITAMGSSNSSYVSLAIAIAGILVLFELAVYIVSKIPPLAHQHFTAKRFALLVLAIAVQGSCYAVSHYLEYRPVLDIADRLPWYQPVTAKNFLAGLNIERSREHGDYQLSKRSRGFEYPPAGVGPFDFKQKYNVVWLVAESWRWDMLTPEIMPRTYEFANLSYRSDHHYSSGNGTRMGMFGQFYGLPGRYWFDALKSRTSPLIIDSFQKNGYAIKAFTSAKFTYPEFDKTIFTNIPDADLQSNAKGAGWERDQKNVSDLLAFTKSAESPFFTFLFFESTHANYTFPEESVITTDYLPDFDYLREDIAESIEQIKNRYINASHYLDLQFDRIIDSLAASGQLDNTIVVITGDHGEEFMENGRWGHNSTFSEQQIRVPLIIHIPGAAPRVETEMTSHLDVPATLLTALAGPNDSSLYSVGGDLMASDHGRDYTIISDWHGEAVVTREFKQILSSKARRRGQNSFTRRNDQPVGASAGTGIDASLMRRYVEDTLRFSGIAPALSATTLSKPEAKGS